MPHLEFTGASVVTRLALGIDQDDLAIKLNDGSGWPTGAGGKQFIVTLGDRTIGQAEEKLLCTSRSNQDIIVAQRGYDGTAPQVWVQNTLARHTIAGVFAAEVSDHIWDDTRDDHSQYHTATRHAAVLHTQGMMGALSIGTPQLIDGSVTTPKVPDLAITTPKVNDLAIVTAKLGNDSVTPDKIADGAIDSADKIVNAIITLAKFASEAATDWSSSITFDNVTLGTGGKYARYIKLGRLVLMFYGFQLGTGGDVTGKIGFNLPFTAADLTGGLGIGNGGGIVVGRAVNPGVFSGLGAILLSDNKATDLITAGGSPTDTWDSNTPHDWQNGSVLQGIIVFMATS